MTGKKVQDQGLEAVKRHIRKQYQRELEALQEILNKLNISMEAEKLVEEYSGLSVGSYVVKDKYRYIKLTGVKTGEKAERTEEWLIRRPEEKKGKERQRRFRRESRHIVNIKQNEVNEILVAWLTKYWSRAKALKKWLEEVEN